MKLFFTSLNDRISYLHQSASCWLRLRMSSIRRTMYSCLPWAIVFFIFLGLFAYLQALIPGLPDGDGFYHITVAKLFRERGIPFRFPWLKLTILDEQHYVDHHFLYHLFLIPFTFFKDLVLGVKTSAVVFGALAFTAFYGVLKLYPVQKPLSWTLLLAAASNLFLYRMNMPRAMSLSLIAQLAFFRFFFKKSYIALGITCALYTWLYNAYPIISMMGSAGLLAVWIQEGKFDFRLAAVLIGGTAFAIIVNPYFPQNLSFVWDHISAKLLVSELPARMPGEWYPFNSWGILTNAALAFIAYFTALILTSKEELLENRSLIYLLIVSTVNLLLYCKSKRFCEYFVPHTILFLAISIREAKSPFGSERIVKLWESVKKAEFVVWFIVGASFFWILTDLKQEYRNYPPADIFKRPAEWLNDNTPYESLIFIANYTDFSPLFFFNQHNTYLGGLDPDFTQRRDPELYRQWIDIVDGRIQDPADLILEKFGSEYVFLEPQHTKFLEILRKNPRFTEVFSDSAASIFQVHRR